MAALTADDARPYARLGSRIALARREQRWSQRELARWAGISEGYLPRIETGRNRPEPDILRRLARILGIDYSELAGLAGYADVPGDDEVAIGVSPEDAHEVRRYAALPAWLKRVLIRIADSMLEEVPERRPEPEPHTEPGEDRDAKSG